MMLARLFSSLIGPRRAVVDAGPLGCESAAAGVNRPTGLSAVIASCAVSCIVSGVAAATLLVGHSAAAQDRITGRSIEGAVDRVSTRVAAAEKPFTLVAFGDSLVAGYGLPVEQGFAPQLETWLHANGAPNVVVVNAGVSGDTTSAGLSRLDWSIGPEADAVLLELGANDGLRGIDPAIARDNLHAMLTRLTERGLPVMIAGMVAPQNWGAEYAEAFAAMYPALAAEFDAPLYPFFLEGLTGDPSYAQDDGLHPSAKGVVKLVETIGPSILEFIETARARPSAG